MGEATGTMLPGSRRLRIALFALVWFSCSWFGSWEFNPNNATRLFAAIALVEDGTATIDPFAAVTIDKARFGGHVYMDKAPGMTLMALPVVALADRLTGTSAHPLTKQLEAPDLGAYLRLRLRWTVALVVAPCTALAALALLDLGIALTGSIAAGLFGALGFALGSVAWGWSTTIFGHAVVGDLLILAVWAIRRGTLVRAQPAMALLAGGALGWAVVVEHQAVMAGAAVGLWALWRLRGLPGSGGALGAAVAGGLLALLPLVAYNEIAFGTLFRLGYQGVTDFAGMNEGLFGLTYPKPAVLYELVIGTRRGLLWVAPVLVLLGTIGIAGLVRMRATRDLGVLAIAVVAVVLLLNASYAYWDGGYATGPRHSVPALPFLALGLAPYWAGIETRAGRIGAAALLGLSMAINLAAAESDMFAPDFYRFPLLDPIWAEHVRTGAVTNLAMEYWGWAPMTGLWCYVAIAVLLLTVCVAEAQRARD